MESMEIDGYRIAIFNVDEKALHITVNANSGRMDFADLQNNVKIKVALINEFSAQMKRLPENWDERIVPTTTNPNCESIIIILK